MFSSFSRKWRSVNDDVADLSDKLHHWSYWKSYTKMVDFLEEKAKSTLSKEISRMPVLLQFFIDTLDQDIVYHIHPEKDQLLDHNRLGTYANLRLWQEAGYKTLRTKRTHKRRLERWQNLFDYGLSFQSEDSDVTTLVTYEDVIKARMTYKKTGVVPYWRIWNDGSRFGSREGYPTYSGIHFVEKGYDLLKRNLRKSVKILEDKVLELLLTDSDYNSEDYDLPILRDANWKSVYDQWRIT